MSHVVPLTKLSAELVEGFAALFLSPLYDNPAPTPDFHRQGWELYCSSHELCTIVAPRESAKSTAFTHDFVLAVICFRIDPYIIVISATEDLAKDHLADIAMVLRDDDDLREHFGVKDLVVDAKTEIIVRFDDGYEARVLAKGAGQKMRGLKWHGRRPGVLVGDDLEEDEQVENADRRRKFRRWFFRALLPARRRGGLVRIHGTILHEDSLLARLQKAKTWHHLFFRAHRSFDDFSDLLWPEQFPIERLRLIRQGYVEQLDASGYSQEYLNDPLDSSDAYLQRPWFLPMEEGDADRPKLILAAADFAISTKDSANRTSLTVGGKDARNLVHFLDQHVGRWDSLDIVEELFAVHNLWQPDCFYVEDGQIWQGLWPVVMREMQRRDIYVNFVARRPIHDKATRGRSLQRRMRALATRWDVEADWFVPMQEELLRFTGTSEARLDDQFDSASLLSLAFDDMAEVEAEDFLEEEELEMLRGDPRNRQGRSHVTGY